MQVCTEHLLLGLVTEDVGKGGRQVWRTNCYFVPPAPIFVPLLLDAVPCAADYMQSLALAINALRANFTHAW